MILQGEKGLSSSNLIAWNHRYVEVIYNENMTTMRAEFPRKLWKFKIDFFSLNR
jgi:hypothetical protein